MGGDGRHLRTTDGASQEGARFSLASAAGAGLRGARVGHCQALNDPHRSTRLERVFWTGGVREVGTL